MRNYHVRFLGENEVLTPPTYPATWKKWFHARTKRHALWQNPNIVHEPHDELCDKIGASCTNQKGQLGKDEINLPQVRKDGISARINFESKLHLRIER